ncbi:10150_t:CDS:1, partial [Ambispora leptoticha]
DTTAMQGHTNIKTPTNSDESWKWYYISQNLVGSNSVTQHSLYPTNTQEPPYKGIEDTAFQF